MGDFNTCLLKNYHRSSLLRAAVSSYNLSIPNTIQHTIFPTLLRRFWTLYLFPHLIMCQNMVNSQLTLFPIMTLYIYPIKSVLLNLNLKSFYNAILVNRISITFVPTLAPLTGLRCTLLTQSSKNLNILLTL
jgi:hypothetical protein